MTEQLQQQRSPSPSSSWSIEFIEDPSSSSFLHHHHGSNSRRGGNAPSSSRRSRSQSVSDNLIRTEIVHVKIPIVDLFLLPNQQGEKAWTAFRDESDGRIGSVALADYVSRLLLNGSDDDEDAGNNNKSYYEFRVERLDRHVHGYRHQFRTSGGKRRRRKGGNNNNVNDYSPFVMERTDVRCDNNDDILHLFLRVLAYRRIRDTAAAGEQQSPMEVTDNNNGKKYEEERIYRESCKAAVCDALRRCLLLDDRSNDSSSSLDRMMNHVATVVLQHRLRTLISTADDNAVVAFVADGSILPRKSGASALPMSSPPAVPFVAPTGIQTGGVGGGTTLPGSDDADEDRYRSPLARTIEIEMGQLCKYLRNRNYLPENLDDHSTSTVVTLRGLVVPKGVTLIVGGGYHGKSTLLRTIACGVYDKVPGDGREFCVTVRDAVSVRAEDGRYVNNCNVSAFISNLPTPPGATKALDTAHFSTGEASGSTSQAANVVEAMEMGAKAFLVDEDVSAANFMARDGRMRSLIMDESITPFLYRVNGIFYSHGISSVVVVGGVGDWLDVPDNVILMDKYLCRDATKKARSVSRQFSHGHVQYAGRGVVHRLQWEKSGTPVPRRPADGFARQFDRSGTTISLLDGNDAIAFHPSDASMNDVDSMMNDDDSYDDEDYFVDLSRCEQLMGRKPQLYGCGLCALWLLEESRKHPEIGLPDLLKRLDAFIDEKGFASVVGGGDDDDDASTMSSSSSAAWKALVESTGHAFRPRRYEVGHAITRFRGIKLEEIPIVDDDGAEAAAKAESERKKRDLMEMWNSRRRKNKSDG